MPVDMGDTKKMYKKQKLIGTWTGRSEPEAIILCSESLGPHF